MANGLKKRFATAAASIKVTAEDIAAADAAPPSAPRTAPGQMMAMQGALHVAEGDIERLKAQLKDAQANAEIALDLIDEVPGRRRKLTQEAYDELKANLSKNKLAQPIVVRKKDGGRYELVAGHNRVAVFRELGRSAIPAFTVDIDDASVDSMAFFSNLLAPSLPDFEKYWNFKRLADSTGLTHQAIAEAAGLSLAHVYRIMRFDDLPDAAKELLCEAPDRLGSTAAEKLAVIAQAGRATEVTEAVRKLVTDEKVTQDEAVAMAKPTAAATPKPEQHTIKKGKQTFCDISLRKNVIGIRFGKSVSEEDAKRWATKFAEFVEAEMAKEE
ncbi:MULTISPECIES: ParB/RepB/Spo0J family partition protein [Cupriavidus]